MPSLEVNGTTLFYQEVGSGPRTIVFSHGLLMSGAMFAEQVKMLSEDYRCICYDHRGQAGSEVSSQGYDMDTLTEDAAELIRQLDCGPCHFIGLSMGGFVGMRLALRHPELVSSLVLMATSADPEPEANKRPYRLLAFIFRYLGPRLVVKRVMRILFGQSFLNDPNSAAQRQQWRVHLLGLDRKGASRAAHGVIERDGVNQALDQITLPTLILVGDEDLATVPEKSERLQRGIVGSRLEVIAEAGHSPTIEQPQAVNHVLMAFLQRHPGKGVAPRRLPVGVSIEAHAMPY